MTGRHWLIATSTAAMQRLTIPANDSHTVSHVADWSELLAVMGRSSPASVVLADPYMGTTAAAGPSEQLCRAMKLHGSVPVIAVIDTREVPVDHLATVMAWGVSGVIDLNMHHQPESVREVLRDVRARPLKRRVEPLLGGASESARIIVRAACEAVVEHGRARALAAICGADSRTVTSWCNTRGLPPPRRLLAWARVLSASMLFAEPGRSITAIARLCGYANDHSLRRAFIDLGVGNPAGFARGEVFARAGDAFRQDIGRWRERQRVSGRDGGKW